MIVAELEVGGSLSVERIVETFEYRMNETMNASKTKYTER